MTQPNEEVIKRIESAEESKDSLRKFPRFWYMDRDFPEIKATHREGHGEILLIVDGIRRDGQIEKTIAEHNLTIRHYEAILAEKDKAIELGVTLYHATKERLDTALAQHLTAMENTRKETLQECFDHFSYSAAISRDQRWTEATGYDSAARWCEKQLCASINENGKSEG